MRVNTERSEHLSDWRKSGQSKKEYCRQTGLAYHRLVYWDSCERKEKDKTMAIGNFVPLPEMGQRQAMIITLPNGIRIETPQLINAGLLKWLKDA